MPLRTSFHSTPKRNQSHSTSPAAYPVKCTPEQQTTLTAATTSATNLISSTLSYLSTLTTDSPRYTTWFGLYDPARIQTVKSNYANSLSAIQSTYDCAPDACQDGSVAYVWRQQPGVVHLCGWFWLRPGYGSDSQAGTIIHELSHFAGTEDYVYGQLGARDLAVSSPGVAVVNADNYMYFAENYPALS
ncbi:unnamed protein product [Rhizoctonia solani]|uniref:Lysine-specific metallo-endopeptidase domain-containing protein n=1 Tax=Rhizoctonia solani TaxID=456999 RepID=A0A8H3HQR4_9AGAM|nr:unnamed protein product [Rhizoctonia solani]